MDFLQTIVDTASMVVIGFGASIGIAGLLKFGEGKSQDNPGAQDEGIKKVVGGGIVMVIGYTLIPELMGFFG